MKDKIVKIKNWWDKQSGPVQLAIFVGSVNVFFVLMCWALSPLWSK